MFQVLIELKKEGESVLKIIVCVVNFDRPINLRHLRKADEKHLAAVME